MAVLVTNTMLFITKEVSFVIKIRIITRYNRYNNKIFKTCQRNSYLNVSMAHVHILVLVNQNTVKINQNLLET